jgi:hypothetical protein
MGMKLGLGHLGGDIIRVFEKRKFRRILRLMK